MFIWVSVNFNAISGKQACMLSLGFLFRSCYQTYKSVQLYSVYWVIISHCFSRSYFSWVKLFFFQVLLLNRWICCNFCVNIYHRPLPPRKRKTLNESLTIILINIFLKLNFEMKTFKKLRTKHIYLHVSTIDKAIHLDLYNFMECAFSITFILILCQVYIRTNSPM